MARKSARSNYSSDNYYQVVIAYVLISFIQMFLKSERLWEIETADVIVQWNPVNTDTKGT